MRLTLRTLLAYMDNILEPKDAEDIGKKIDESEVATTLLHRARDVMRRLRLKAPDVDERGSGLDPNTVAEYLDNVLPDDRVPDFEKVCLESDMHLAEVASCHQILALVLGEPAEVDPTSREHMYQLPQVLAELETMEARETVEPEATDGDAVVPPPPIPRRPKPIVPDYLREGGKRRRRLLPVAVVLVLLVGGGVVLGLTGRLRFLGIGPREEQVAVDVFGDGEVEAAPEVGGGGKVVEGVATGEVGPATPTTPEEATAEVKPLPAPPAAIARPRPAQAEGTVPVAQPSPAAPIPPAAPTSVPAETAPAEPGVAPGAPAAAGEPSVEPPGSPGQPAGIGTPSPPAAVPAPPAAEP
ncbi:MAG: hypothetical protein NTW96_22390, partial [Planctomycetia bacterium]|nr:hypothetical protein [Planctomycetia bacterium]